MGVRDGDRPGKDSRPAALASAGLAHPAGSGHTDAVWLKRTVLVVCTETLPHIDFQLRQEENRVRRKEGGGPARVVATLQPVTPSREPGGPGTMNGQHLSDSELQVPRMSGLSAKKRILGGEGPRPAGGGQVDRVPQPWRPRGWPGARKAA